MKILIGTNQLGPIAGSEIVAFEFAAQFRERGHEVHLFANLSGTPMADLCRKRLGVEVITTPEAVDPLSYDLLYLQHHVAGLFAFRETGHMREKTAIVFGRLGRRTFMESGGWRHDRILADHVFANSELTAEKLKAVGTEAPVTVFYNAAPDAFFRDRPSVGGRLKTITVVTNHPDPDLFQALEVLSRTCDIRRIGQGLPDYQLVTPQTIHDSDLVIAIGKTVPYALAARTPVYVYDHFGGPGYLRPDTFANARRHNFSGRCCERRLPPDALAAEIVHDYPQGVAFARDLADAELDRFKLQRHADLMLAVAPSCNRTRLAALAADPMIENERQLAEHVRIFYHIAAGSRP